MRFLTRYFAMRSFSLLFLLTALPLSAAFTKVTQTVPLDYGQKEVQVVFEADGEIKRAHPLCECTKVRVEGNRLIARVDTEGFSQDIEKQIDATLADGTSARLTMRFKVPQALTLSQRSLVWKQGGEASTKTLKITIPKGSPVHNVTEAAISGDDFEYTPRKVKEGAEYAVDVTPRSVSQKKLNRLIIKTDSVDKRYAAYIIYLSIQP